MGPPQRTPEEQAEFDRVQAEAREAAAAKQREIERRARGDDDDGTGGIRQPRQPIAPGPHDPGTTADE